MASKKGMRNENKKARKARVRAGDRERRIEQRERDRLAARARRDDHDGELSEEFVAQAVEG